MYKGIVISVFLDLHLYLQLMSISEHSAVQGKNANQAKHSFTWMEALPTQFVRMKFSFH